MAPVEVLALGACLLSRPFGELQIRRLVEDGSVLQRNGVSNDYYTLDEAIQAVNFYHGDYQVPRDLRKFCSLNPDWEGSSGDVELYGASEVALIEINSPVRIGYGPYSLCRAAVNTEILIPLADMSEELHLVGNDWYYRGVMNGGDDMRASTAEKLVEAISDEFPDAKLARSILREARPHRRDFNELVEGLAVLKELVRAPLGVVTYTNHYLPDGRPLPWPTDLVDQTIAAAKRLNLPLFNPSEIVMKYGVSRAMREDRTHYTDEFAPVLADALFAFITRVAARVTA